MMEEDNSILDLTTYLGLLYSGKHYRIQVGQDSLIITAKDGRGTVYQEQGNQVQSKLEQQDFGRFAQAIKTIEQQQPNLSQQRQVEIG